MISVSNVFVKFIYKYSLCFGRSCEEDMWSSSPPLPTCGESETSWHEGQEQSGNAIPTNICVKIHQHISKYEICLGGGYTSSSNCCEMQNMFLNVYLGLKKFKKYNLYYSYLKKTSTTTWPPLGGCMLSIRKSVQQTETSSLQPQVLPRYLYSLKENQYIF